MDNNNKVYDLTDQEISTVEPDRLPIIIEPKSLIGRWLYMQMRGWGFSHFETVLVGYVASIGHNNDFKVYMDWGERRDVHTVANHGIKVRDEGFAREIFPELSHLEFKVN